MLSCVLGPLGLTVSASGLPSASNCLEPRISSSPRSRLPLGIGMEDREKPSRRILPRAKAVRLVVYGFLLLIGLFACWLFRGTIGFQNLGVVDSGRVYRCAQPGPNLEATVEALGIRSILNLRGGSLEDEFYRTEVEVADRLQLSFYDLPMSATHRPSRTEILRLLDVLDHCEYPLLIHCKSGADRTGLATTLYRLQKRGEDPLSAEDGFSLIYGHVPLFGPERLHEPIGEYNEWLTRNHLPHTPSRFRHWVTWDYQDEDQPGKVPQQMESGPRARLATARTKKTGKDEISR